MYGERPNVVVRGSLRECREFPSDSVGELALQGVWQPVYRFEDQVCDKKGCPNTIETPHSIYAYHKTRCELEEKKVHRRGCTEVLLTLSRVAVKIGGPDARGASPEMSIHLFKHPEPIHSRCTSGEGDCMIAAIENSLVY